jgi:hypothetical protein
MECFVRNKKVLQNIGWKRLGKSLGTHRRAWDGSIKIGIRHLGCEGVD